MPSYPHGVLAELERRKPTLWIDSNVMAEVMSQGDIYADQSRGADIVEQRRMMLQDAYWLAVALDERAAATVAYWHEVYRVIRKLAPPGSSAGVWTFTWAAVLHPHVFNRWHGEWSMQGEALDNDARDQLMVDLCKADGFTLITHDRGATKRAKRANIDVLEPRTYAASVLSVSDARTRFFERLAVGALHHAVEGDRFDRPRRAQIMINTHDVYRTIWAPPGFIRGAFGTPTTITEVYASWLRGAR